MADKPKNSTENNSINFAGYNLSEPDEIIILPSVLHEISGIVLKDTSSVACIQDEHGVIFIYDLIKKEIREYINFHGNGDYEGIARVKDTLFVLRSDGLLYKVTNITSGDIVADEIRLKKLSDNDNEGLCYDRKNNMLLIAHKDKGGKHSEDKDKRVIYDFDLSTEKLNNEPVISFDLAEINRFALQNNIITKKEGKDKSKKKGDKAKIKFRPSDIAIHPLTGKLFVISAPEHLAFVFEPDGTINEMVKLPPKIFTMPEGITFFENGDMLISNEGRNRVPTLLRFNYRK